MATVPEKQNKTKTRMEVKCLEIHRLVTDNESAQNKAQDLG